MDASVRHAVVILLVAAACARPVPAPQPLHGPARLAIVTWNMHAGAGDLPRLVDDLASGRLSGSPARDYVLLLQEAVRGGRHDPADVARARHLAIYYIPVRPAAHAAPPGSVQATSGNAIVSTLPLIETREIDLPRERQMRSAAEAFVNVDGTRLFIVDAHLENRVSMLRGGLFSDTARRHQAEALLEAIPPGPGIAGGDFNTWLGPSEPAWREFLARFGDTPAGPATPTFHDRLVLDHLFFDLPDGWRAARRVIHERYHSDHNPVLGLIETR